MKSTSVIASSLGVAAMTMLFAAPASAGAGDWDYQGSDVFTTQSKNFSSGGGSFKVCLTPGSKYGSYRLMEEDPFGPDDIVTTHDGIYGTDFGHPDDTDRNRCFVYRDLNSYRDGSNGQAEFYLKKWSGGNSKVHAYD